MQQVSAMGPCNEIVTIRQQLRSFNVASKVSITNNVICVAEVIIKFCSLFLAYGVSPQLAQIITWAPELETADS